MEILFFHAPWCGPCKAYMKNELPKIEKEHEVHSIDCQADGRSAADGNGHGRHRRSARRRGSRCLQHAG